MNLSKRLNTLISMVSPCKTAADIGTDHGFVPIELVKTGKAEKAIASDVRPRPLERARDHVSEAGLTDRIDCRLGSGLETLKTGEADAVIIAGMGGLLVKELLLTSKEVTLSAKELILSPHTDVPEVRKTAAELGFRIDAEAMVEEEGKYYTIMRAVKAEEGSDASLTPEEAVFGPCLLKERPEVFLDWLRYEEKRYEAVLEKTASAPEKSAELRLKQSAVRDVLRGRTVRKTYPEDFEAIRDIYSQARAFMKETGNPTQWGNNKPEDQTILSDIRNGTNRVVIENGRIIGVFALFFEPDPTYSYIEQGSGWLNDEPYATIHRIAGPGAKGVLQTAVNYAQARSKNVRIDTHENNLVMQHLVTKAGFKRCGIIYLEDGDPRIAYHLC